jgi:hypothetical protein
MQFAPKLAEFDSDAEDDLLDMSNLDDELKSIDKEIKS